MNQNLERLLLIVTERFAAGDVDDAMQQMSDLEAACTSPQERSQVLARYASFFHLLELREEELSALAEALALDPTNPRAHYLRALLLMADERFEDAVKSLHSAAYYYPTDDAVHLAEVYGNLSYCWNALGDKDRAALYESLSAELDPEGSPVEQDSEPLPEGAFELEVEPELLAASGGDTSEADFCKPLEEGEDPLPPLPEKDSEMLDHLVQTLAGRETLPQPPTAPPLEVSSPEKSDRPRIARGKRRRR